MPLPAKFFIAFVIVLALIGGVAWLVRRFGSGGLGSASARGRQARLGVIEATAVDSRRRLVLVRRDNVEHLIMLGGPTDVVVEANIVRGQPAAPMRDVPTPRMEQPGRPAAENGLWAPAAPLAPEPAFRAGRGGERAMIQPIAEDLPLQPQAEPAPRPQTVDRLAGLAAELGRSAPPPIVDPRMAEPRMSEPRMPEMRPPEPRMPDMRAQEPWMPEPRMPEPRAAEPRMPEPRMPEPRTPEHRPAEHRPADARRPVGELRRPLEPRRAPPAPPAAPPAAPAGENDHGGDRQLAAMAEQLEAALRRSGGSERPSEPAAEAVPSPPPAAPPAARPRPSLRSPLEPRSSLLRGTSPARPPMSEPPPPPAPQAETAAEPVPPPAGEEPAQAHAAPPAPQPQDSKPSGKTAYESLEEEMANLLGRAPGKP
ncbi:hypothetical protein J2S22_000216 [Rhodoplanes tepidamans]|uniref:Flagellar biosynthetic protein FliO n=2 Tax=Rhodoplanes TaxID=29407 RepID=A0ABT5J789_RHOTP|nr:flagellar biosynthetic protein FliO [Rhodoplanes tepidamans]MDC7785520.1 flagellar biosynthetic protein FliO [Rhodoplanes tepidamans]MDQ0353310.1 hypothetical protein [Rhodoplanes tepidamans]